MTKKIETGPTVMLDYLERVLGSTSFEDFEKVFSGELTIGGVKFFMRVGLYMNRPVQAIMALGIYVKLRPYNPYNIANDSLEELYPLDPLNPSKNMYEISMAEKLEANKPTITLINPLGAFLRDKKWLRKR